MDRKIGWIMAVANGVFLKGAAAAADEARRVLGRRDGDVGWLRGAPENMPLALVKSEALVDDTFDDCPLSG
ncbi:hypothetical protein ACLKMY_25100 [Paraburkholderia mimosarum]|uniref:hypothetical protein n=1 Tax=Paraburkholderia mimosarum TaxID=312026 RepID=UPI0039C09EDE